MGVAWTVTVFTETLYKAEKAITAALDEVSRLENVLSDYQPTSEMMVTDFAHKIKARLPKNIDLVALKLRETASSYAEWIAEEQA